VTGIAQMFADLASDRDDEAWFQLAFYFEQQEARRNEKQRDRYAPKQVLKYQCGSCGSREHTAARCETGKERHGTRSRWVYHRCRCDLCRAANNKYWREQYAAKKAAQQQQEGKAA
jgi:hypothetical protein